MQPHLQVLEWEPPTKKNLDPGLDESLRLGYGGGASSFAEWGRVHLSIKLKFACCIPTGAFITLKQQEPVDMSEGVSGE